MPRLLKKYFQAKNLRQKGYSLKEISQKLEISKSTASLWLKDVELSKNAVCRLKRRGFLGRLRSADTKRRKRREANKQREKEAIRFLNETEIKNGHLKLFCALLFECEGNKDTRGGIYFTNSDPKIIKVFLSFLRSSFEIEESKLRVGLHLHKYHSPKKQIRFWSEITSIPDVQFIKPYQKSNTGKRVKRGYQGCANIRYYDSALALNLSAISKAILNKYSK